MSTTTDSKAKIKSEKHRGGGILFSIVSLLSALLVIAVVLAAFLFTVIRMNFLGVADTYRDSIENVPLLKIALPKVENTDPNNMTLDELLVLYNQSKTDNEQLKNDVDSANKRIEELSKAKSDYDAQTLINNEKTEQLQQQVMTLEANKKQLDDMKYDLERIAANGDKEAFAKYYADVSPEVAQDIYAQIIQEQKAGDEKKEFIKLFSALDTKASVDIIETLGASRIDFIADTLKSVKRDIAAEIIASLSPELAAQITLRLSGN